MSFRDRRPMQLCRRDWSSPEVLCSLEQLHRPSARINRALRMTRAGAKNASNVADLHQSLAPEIGVPADREKILCSRSPYGGDGVTPGRWHHFYF